MAMYKADIPSLAINSTLDTLKGHGASNIRIVKQDKTNTVIQFDTTPETEDSALDYLGDQGMPFESVVVSSRKAAMRMMSKEQAAEFGIPDFALRASGSSLPEGAVHLDEVHSIGDVVPNPYGENPPYLVVIATGNGGSVGTKFHKQRGPTGSRKAAPNEFSGLNPNTPVRTYDTHPNEYFEEGDVVLPLDTEEAPVTGIVLARVAEDRLLVDWGRVIAQEDVDDLVKASEWKFTLRQEGRPKSPMQVEDPLPGIRGASRVAFWTNRPTWMGGQGSFQQQFQNAANTGTIPNQLKYPAVKEMLLKSGMHPHVLDQLTQTLDHFQQQATAKQQQATQAQNEALFQGDWSGFFGGPHPTPLQFGQNTLQGQRAKLVPSGSTVIPPNSPWKTGVPGVVPGGQLTPAGSNLPTEIHPSGMLSPNVVPQSSTVGPFAQQPVGVSAARKAALCRKAGIRELLFQASALEAIGDKTKADKVRVAADIAAAMHSLYKHSNTRKESVKASQQAVRIASSSILDIAKDLRDEGLEEPANSIENAAVASMTYERFPASEN